MKNAQIAKIFKDIAMILELKGDNPFRIRAYEKAAFNIESLPEDLDVILDKGGLRNIPGIGKDLAAKIEEIIRSGTLKFYEKLKRETPPGLILMLDIPGLGPRTVKNIYDKLKIDTIDKLEAAARKGKLQSIEGIKRKTEENIIKGIKLIKKGDKRTLLYLALNTADSFINNLKTIKAVRRIEYAGSLRRRKETVKDIDILIKSNNPSRIMNAFVKHPSVKEVIAKGSTKASVLAGERNIQIDLRVVKNESFGAALMYFTGSKQFNIKMRKLALKRGYKINEYGVFDEKKNKRLRGKTENEIFSFMKMDYIPPELREDRGEIEASLRGSLPELVELKDIKGDLHVHSLYSDGRASIPQIAEEAIKRNYQYIAITDHSQSLRVAGGLQRKEVYKKIEEIRKLNKKMKGIRILCGTEADILKEGKIDYPESILKEFDIVIASIHSGFKQSKGQLTRRMVAACKNKYVHIIGHPTGRLIGIRPEYDVDMDEVIKAARDYDTALEINCHYQRLDLGDINILHAKNSGVKLSLGTDAHSLEQLDMMKFGLSVARRGWLEKKDTLNCMDLKEIIGWLKG